MAQWVEVAVTPDELSSTPGSHRVDGIRRLILSSGPLTPIYAHAVWHIHTHIQTHDYNKFSSLYPDYSPWSSVLCFLPVNNSLHLSSIQHKQVSLKPLNGERTF